tara:strand:+ start:321 stop:644 length:324 start_codon:yes stop_codon:yes gene_type:complete
MLTQHNNKETMSENKDYNELMLHQIKGLRKDIVELTKEMMSVSRKADGFESTKEFVDDLKDVATIDQYNKLYENVSNLENFKNRAVTVFAVIQTIVIGVAWYLSYKK